MDLTIDSDCADLGAAARRAFAGATNDNAWSHLKRLGALELFSGGWDPADHSATLAAMVVCQELGRAGLRTPFVESAISVPILLALLPVDRESMSWVTDVSQGRSLVALADQEPRAGSRVGGRFSRIKHVPDRWVVSGVKAPVAFGAAADRFLVTGRGDDGDLSMLVVDAHEVGVDCSEALSYDNTPTACVNFVDAVGSPLHGNVRRALMVAEAIASLALAGEAIGAMEAALDLTTSYLRVRTQFGRPLTAFQALTHRAADMYVALELARSALLYGVASVGEVDHDGIAVVRAVRQVCKATRFIAQGAIQLHGGVGMMAESGVAQHAARLTAIDVRLGAVGPLEELAANLDPFSAVEVLR